MTKNSKNNMSIVNFLCQYTWQPVLFVVLIVSGGYVFVYLENPQEGKKVKSENQLQSIEDDLIQKFNLTKQTLDDYFAERQQVENIERPLTPIKAFALCQSIALTSGWGRIVPTTKESKIFFLFYSCFSITITAIILKSVSDILHQIIVKLTHFIELSVLKKRRVEQVQLKCFLVSCLLVVLSAAISSWLQVYFGKSTLDAVYVTFQAYSTIGFGDIRQFKSLQVTASFLPLLCAMQILRVIGIVLLATLINSFVRFKIERELLIKAKAEKKIGVIKRKSREIMWDD